MSILREVLRKNRNAILIFFVMTAANAAVFALYGVFSEPLVYGFFLAFFALAALLLSDFIGERNQSQERRRALKAVLSSWRVLPPAKSLAEKEYQQMIAALGAEIDRMTAAADAGRQDMEDYYTAWVHQIKTPIAVMRLKLSDDTPRDRALLAELGRVERYVDMVLQYIRVGSKSSDLVIREYDLDEMIREAVRRQAAQFVEKRLRLDFAPTGVRVATDQKWLVLILDQLLSNAVKYTPSGTVTVSFRDGLLTVSDTGIGIAGEDLPRIFEKGYTGINGRLGQKSSGLGLYLAKKAAELLAVPLSAQSAPGAGSAFTLDLRGKEAYPVNQHA